MSCDTHELTSSCVSLTYPPEILFLICAHIYSSGLPPNRESSLDPLILKDYGVPTALPSSVPGSHWPEPVARRALVNLCRVNHAWYEAAKPWLWTKLEVRLPYNWMSLVEEVAWEYDEEKVDAVVGDTLEAAAQAAISSSESNELLCLESFLENLGPDTSIDPELLSPVASRDPSPRRLRPKSKSPARWKLVRSINNAILNALEIKEPGLYVPAPVDPRPGRFVRHLDFNHFRTIGMRRSGDEGVNSRFVTGDRVRAVLREMPNLTAFGATEYMDGALTLPVLNELLLRGAPSSCGRGRKLRGRVLHAVDVQDQDEEEERERRQDCRDLEAIDLTGCVSAVFVNALTEFVNTHILSSHSAEARAESNPEGRRQRVVRFVEEPIVFPGLKRLGLRGVKSIPPRVLAPFILSFTGLTHVDLSGTRVTPDILYALGESPSIRLSSLAIARCTKVTSACIRDFLVDSPVTFGLKELNLYGDMTYTSSLVEEDLWDVITLSPCFLGGQLEYLDISSAPLSNDMLLKGISAQPRLRSLGMSHIPNLELKVIAEFLKIRAPHVEVLTLIGTSPELDCGLRPGTNPGTQRGSPRQSSIDLHTYLIRPLCMPPFSFSLTSSSAPARPPTRLRVIELSLAMLGGLGAGAGAWRIVRSKGGRGWYVDTASAWVAQAGTAEGCILRRDLETGHPYRTEIEKLSSCNGNVSSGVGWHARKMEILHGYGMLGREDGLYGAVSFAFQG